MKGEIYDELRSYKKRIKRGKNNKERGIYMKNEIIVNENMFESIKHIDEFGNEYWEARELQKLLEYKKWEKFLNVINDAMKACKQSNNLIEDHFPQVGKMVKIGSTAKRNVIRYHEDILDRMGSDELIANLFRISQTEQKLKRDNIQGESNAKDTHYEVGRKVRKAIADIGGMMPEEMPTPDKNLKELKKEEKRIEIK